MIENNLLKTNFLGKDGFRWWIGQVAPEDAQGDQINQIGNTWGSRVKVRIYGYHPPNETELKNIDLPWAQVLLSPQGGSGKANRARSIRVAPGDTVMGFFLDGDDAQLPVILGIFASTASYYGGSEEYTVPFQPFTGYTSKIKPNNEFIPVNEGGDDSRNSQVSPRFLTKEIVDDLNKKDKVDISNSLSNLNRREVKLTTKEIEKFYYGLSNKCIWPLFHYFIEYAKFNENDWKSYVKVNQKFCDEVVKQAAANGTVWVHDYQLLLLPKMIKESRPDLTIGFFLHIPFPSFEIFRIFPWRNDLLEGILGADLVGFHTFDYQRHFLSSVKRILRSFFEKRLCS